MTYKLCCSRIKVKLPTIRRSGHLAAHCQTLYHQFLLVNINLNFISTKYLSKSEKDPFGYNYRIYRDIFISISYSFIFGTCEIHDNRHNERERKRFQFFCYVIVGVNKLVCRSLRLTDKAVSETKMKLAKFFILKEIIRENNKYDLRFKFTLTK